MSSSSVRFPIAASMLLAAILAAPLAAQSLTITGRVTSDAGAPLQGASVILRGTPFGTLTSREGTYSVRATPGQVLVFRLIGYAQETRTVGTDAVVNVELRRQALSLDATVVTALGQTTQQRNVGTAQQSVEGAEIVQSTRQNFVNALQGRVAGVEVTSSSGVPGASSSITIRGVSSISGSNQPLMIIDGLPMDNKTLNTNVLASDAPGSTTAFNNRGLDFTNRAADLNPDDIETLVVLKGPEAAALYGIDAANGAIVITTKRGRAGTSGFEYSNFFRMERTRARPEVQRVYGPTTIAGGVLGSFFYFGQPYAAGTTFFDNVDGFFQEALTQRHSLSFSGAAADARMNYRVAASTDRQEGVVPGNRYNRVTLTGATQGQVTSWLTADLSMNYSRADNDQSYKGDAGPLIGLLVWPSTDNARDYLTPAGQRRRLTTLAANNETDNPYFNIDKNRNNSVNSRLIMNLGLVFNPGRIGTIRMNIGQDGYTNENLVLRHPESALAQSVNGVLDLAADVTRNLNIQTVASLTPIQLPQGFTLSGLVGNQISDFRSQTNALKGQDFLDPGFVSINNT
nr:TonB-dependent receptor plug domain-containing protein [Gemmatimonadaceae bacterium]